MLIPVSRFRNVNYLLSIVVLCFAGTLVFSGNLLAPKFQALGDLNDKIEQKRNEIKYEQDYLANLEKTKSELGAYDKELAKIDSALPNNAFLPPVFDFLQKAAAQSGLALKDLGSFSVSASDKYPKLKEAVLSLTFSGPYSSLKYFISALEQSSRIIEVKSISFTSPSLSQTTEVGKKKTAEEAFNFNMALKVYSY